MSVKRYGSWRTTMLASYVAQGVWKGVVKQLKSNEIREGKALCSVTGCVASLMDLKNDFALEVVSNDTTYSHLLNWELQVILLSLTLQKHQMKSHYVRTFIKFLVAHMLYGVFGWIFIVLLHISFGNRRKCFNVNILKSNEYNIIFTGFFSLYWQ